MATKGNKADRPSSAEYDRTDRKIIALLEINPTLTQNDIAKELGLSQSSIAIRLYKLKELSLLMEARGVNYAVLGMLMCRVDVDTTDVTGVLEWARNCPLFFNASKGTGEDSLSLFFSAEDNDMFHYIIDEHIRKIEGVKNVHFAMIRSWERPFMLQLNLDYSSKEKPPCGLMPYCPKCPSNPNYDGKIWNHKRLRELIQDNQ